jgi:site-specific recombinase XerC
MLPPPQNGRVRYAYAPFAHQSDQVSITELKAQIPADAQNHDLPIEVPTLEQFFDRHELWHPSIIAECGRVCTRAVKRMVAEEYLTSNIAAGLKTPKTARRSDRSRLRRMTLAEYLRPWTALEERERLAFDLVTFCGLRESEAYGLKNGDLNQQGAIRVEKSWYRGDINPTKTDEIRDVGVGAETMERLMAWIATLPEGNHEGGLSERADCNTAAVGQRPAPMHPSAPDGAGTRLDQLRRLETVALHPTPGKRYGPQDYR